MTSFTTTYGRNGATVLSGSKGNFILDLRDKLSSIFLFRIRLLHIVIFFAVLVFGARLTTLVTHLGEKNLFKEAYAGKGESDKKIDGLDQLPESSPKTRIIKSMDEFDPFNMTADQYRALKGVVSRGDQLSDRERSITEKEQVLEALIKKMDEKVAELNMAKGELQALIDKIDEDENANTIRLVKMAESMKAPQAAKVLEGVEFPILLEIMEKMKEKNASAILAAMEAEKASYLMTALSKRRKVFKKGKPGKGIMKG